MCNTRKKIIAFFAVVISIITLSLPSVLRAQPASYLVKGSGSTIYYNSNNGNRYFFPNESIFKSWYPDFSQIAKVTDAELAALPLTGNVTYRPGSTLIKITTDPKVYAVSRYGILHWITNESVARSIYGDKWNQKVVDVPDTYFSNYLIGYNIEAANQFNQNEQLATATTPGENIRPVGYSPETTPPVAPKPEYNTAKLELNLSATQAVVNQTVYVFANVKNNPLPITKIIIRSNKQSEPLITCSNTDNCSYFFNVNSSPDQITFYGEAFDSAGKTIMVSENEKPVLNIASANSNLQLSLTPSNTVTGGKVSFSSDASKIQNISSHSIFALIPGEKYPILWKDCGTSIICASSSPFYRNTYLYAHVISLGQTLVSPSVQITVSGSEPPKASITLKSKPSPNQFEISLKAPTGEMIGLTSLVEGTTLEDRALAMCEADCSLTLQITKATDLTAFSYVGGKYEKSNTLNIAP